MRRNVARTARVSIDMPGTTEIGILVNDFRVDTKLLLYLDGSAHATETEHVEHIIKLVSGLTDLRWRKCFDPYPAPITPILRSCFIGKFLFQVGEKGELDIGSERGERMI